VRLALLQREGVMAEELVTVYTVGDPIKASIVRNALEAEGIPAYIEGANQAAFEGLTGIEIKIQVATGDVERATEFLQEHKRRRESDADDEAESE
jgi:hypothetical protein